MGQPHFRARRSAWHFFIHTTGVAVLAAMAGATPVAAQSLTSTQTLVLERLTVTATRSAKSVLEVPKSVTVVDGETLDKRVVRDIQDLARYEPGVQVDRSSSATTPWATLGGFTIRGVSGNRVQMQVDGSRVMEAIIDGSRDVVDPWNMREIEIVKGPSSVLWGADALGGIVAFRTLEPEDLLSETENPYRFEAKTAYDSFDQSVRRQFNAAFEAGDFQILGSIGDMEGHEPRLSNARADGGIWGCSRLPKWDCGRFYPTDVQSYNGLAKVVWTPSADHEIKVTGEFFSEHSAVDQVDFGANAVTSNPTTTQYINDYVRNVLVDRTRLAIEHDWTVGEDWLDSVSWKLSYSPQRRGTDSDRLQTYSNRTVTQDALRDYRENFLEAEVTLVSSFELGASAHKLTYGVDGDFTTAFYDDRTRTVTDYFVSPPADTVVNSTYSGFSFPNSETQRAGLFVQDEIELLDGRLTVTPGARLAYYSIDPTKGAGPTYLPGNRPQRIESLSLLKSLSAMYELTEQVSVYASYDEGFKMPTAQQLFVSAVDPFSGTEVIPNPNLRPESVVGYEAGIKAELDRGYLSVSAFHADYTDFIARLQVIGPNQVTSLNLAKVKLLGVEVSGEYEVVDNVFVHGSATYQYGRQVATPGAQDAFYELATPMTAVLGVRYEIPEHGLEFDVIGTFAAGPTDRNSPDAFKPDGYALFDAYVKWEPNENVELTAGIQNIFDTRYFPNTLSVLQTPSALNSNTPPELMTGPGRVFKLGANFKY